MVTTRKHRQATALTRLSLFRHLLFIPIIFLIYATAAANDLYSVVSDSEVSVKNGQGATSKTLTLIHNEETVTALEEAGIWIKIRTATGTEGWVLKRYLSNAPSVDDAFTLPTKNNQTVKQPASPEKSTPLGEQNLQTSPSEIKVTAEKNSPTPSKIPTSLTTALTQNEPEKSDANESPEELRNRVTALTLENKELRENERIRWFLTGGGVLVCGWLIGLITCRSRKRKPSLL
jgi:SH3 domain protein